MIPAYAVRGIKLSPWHFNASMRVFKFGTCDGLIEPGPPIRIIAVNNDYHGNGDFHNLMSAFEEIAAETKAPLQVVQIWNDRLAAWLARRGYVVTDDSELGRHATKMPGV